MESDAFGETTIKTQTTTNNLRFPGQYADDAIGLSQNYFRDYAPNLGRYIESDPIRLSGGINVYEYSFSSPVRFYDMFGLAPSCKKYWTKWRKKYRPRDGEWKLLYYDYKLKPGGREIPGTSIINPVSTYTVICVLKQYGNYLVSQLQTYERQQIEVCYTSSCEEDILFTQVVGFDNKTEEIGVKLKRKEVSERRRDFHSKLSPIYAQNKCIEWIKSLYINDRYSY